MCNAKLYHFDPATAAKNVVLASLVESLQERANGGGEDGPEEMTPPIQEWSAVVTPISDDNGHELPIGEFKLTLKNSQFVAKPSLFIAVVDRSGSMAGGPWRQVESALLHIMGLTHSNGLVKTVIVAYESYGEIINTSGPSSSFLIWWVEN